METKILASFLSGTGLLAFWVGAALAFAAMANGSETFKKVDPPKAQEENYSLKSMKSVSIGNLNTLDADMRLEEQSIILHNAYDLAGEAVEMHQMMRAFDDAK